MLSRGGGGGNEYNRRGASVKNTSGGPRRGKRSDERTDGRSSEGFREERGARGTDGTEEPMPKTGRIRNDVARNLIPRG